MKNGPPKATVIVMRKGSIHLRKTFARRRTVAKICFTNADRKFRKKRAVLVKMNPYQNHRNFAGVLTLTEAKVSKTNLNRHTYLAYSVWLEYPVDMRLQTKSSSHRATEIIMEKKEFLYRKSSLENDAKNSSQEISSLHTAGDLKDATPT